MIRSLSSVLVLAAMVASLSSCDSGSNSTKNDSPTPRDTSGIPADRVAAPVFSPAGGTYAAAQTVRVTSATSGAVLFYTTDGSTPTTSSTRYVVPLTVGTSMTLKAIAVKSGMTTSSVSSAAFAIASSGHGTEIPWNDSIAYGSLDYEGQTYRTVVIGTQTWMAENLNFKVDSSWCYGKSSDSCGKYGRLYQWAAALKLPDSCNHKSCSTQVRPKHQGVCPSGWHVPGDLEWRSLATNIGGAASAGIKLKSRSGWSGKPGNGTDAYGFRVVPAGQRYYDRTFDGAGDYGLIWSSSEVDPDFSWFRSLRSDYALIPDYSGKSSGYSVRCLKD